MRLPPLLRPALLAALLSLATGCQRPAAPSPAPAVPTVQAPPEVPPALAPLAWRSHSVQPGALLAQHPASAQDCELSCTVGREPAPRWRVQGCLARASDFRFVAADCSRALVVYELPAPAKHWSQATVALALRAPEPGASEVQRVSVQAARWLSDAAALRRAGDSFFWLAGTGGLFGRRPRDLPDGSGVELDGVGGATLQVRFDDPRFALWGQPVADAVPAPEVADSQFGLYRWTDAEGTVHFEESLAQVPARFRSRAVRTAGGDISQMHSLTQPGAQPATRTASSQVVIAAPAREPAPRAPRQDPNSVYAPGENHLTYSARIAHEAAMRQYGDNRTHGLGSDDPSQRVAHDCRPAGASCASRLDCCSGTCSASSCK